MGTYRSMTVAAVIVILAGSAGCGSSSGSDPVGGTGGASNTGTGGQGTPPGSGGQPGPAGSGGAVVPGTGGRPGGTGGAGTGGALPVGSGGQSTASGGAVGSGGAPAAGGATAAPAYWIAPDGLDTNPGTEAQPLKTLVAAHARAVAGATIWVKPGAYAFAATVSLVKNGSAALPLSVFAAPGARPVLNFSLQTRGDSAARGISIKGDYWHLRGLEVINAGDNCIHIHGSHNTIENVVTHGCDDTGIQITVDSAFAGDATRGAYNTILNCDSYDNYDSVTGGENADGFAAKLYIGPGNVFRGCRAWNNSDDGWDFFAANDAVTIDGCWAFLNGKTSAGQSNPKGDGNGFKLGGAPAAGDANMGGAVHVVTKSFAFENLACGFVRNNNPTIPMLAMCGGRADAKGEYCSLTNPSPVAFTMTGAQAKVAARNADGTLPAIQ